jgi:WD40 repeat protein
VIDFGVAKAAGQALTDKTLVTGFGNIVGTLEYMSPEQAEINQLDIDTRSDIYSLGVLLYELLAGSPPFTRKELEKVGMMEMLRIIREQEPTKPSTKLSTAEGLPTLAANRGTEPAKLTKLMRGELDWIVMKALEKDRNRRYETANGFALDVQRYLADEPVQACPPSAGYRFRKFARRNKVALAMTAVIALALLTGGVALAISEVRVRKETQAKLGAEKQRADAATEQARAEKQRADALEKWRQTAHYLRIGLAFNEYQANKVTRADQALDECETDLRNWEWRYLKRLCHSESNSVPLGASGVRQAALSPDGSRIAIGRPERGEVRIYDSATGKELVHCALGQFFRNNPAFSSDGKQLATAGSDRQGMAVHVCDADTGKAVAVLRGQGPGQELYSAAFSPDGKRVAGADTQGNLFIWDAATGERQLHVQAHNAANLIDIRWTTVAFHPGGAWLATACAADGLVKIWETEKGTLLRSLGQGDGFSHVVISPKGTWVAAAGRFIGRIPDPSVRLWDAKTGQTRQVFRHARPVFCLAFSRDENRLVVGHSDGTLTLWDVQTGQEVAVYRGHAGWVSAVAFSADGRLVHSFGEDGLVKTWDTTRAPEALILKEGRGAYHAALSPDGRLVAAAAMNGEVNIWEADTGKQVQKFLKGGEYGPKMVAFSPDGAHLAAAITDDNPGPHCGYVKVWEVKTGKLVHTLPDPAREPGPLTAAVAFSPDGKRLASGGLDRAVRIWDLATGKELLRLPGHSRSVTGLGFSRDGQRLVSATGGWGFEWAGPDRGPLKLKPDNDSLIPDLKVWDLATGKEILNLSRKDKVRQAVAISPDGEVVAAAFADNSVRLFSVATGKEVRILKGHSQLVYGIAFSPDGKRLVTGGGYDESVKLWDAQTGEEILTLDRAPAFEVWSVGFSADGRRIVASSFEDVRVWDATPLLKK